MILYFSGTGNSRFAAEKIGAYLQTEVVSMNERIRQKNHAPLQSETPFVFVTPTYAWQIPRIVRDHIQITKCRGSRKVYFVMTCGSEIGNAEAYLRKLCTDKGFDFMGVYPLVMPENFIAMFETPQPAEARRLVDAALPEMKACAQLIQQGKAFLSHKPTLQDKLLSTVVNPVFYKACVHDSGFWVTDACISCGRCASLCPLHDIDLQNGRPVWNGNCTFCMACINACPTAAIEYKKKSVGKPRYYLTDTAR